MVMRNLKVFEKNKLCYRFRFHSLTIEGRVAMLAGQRGRLKIKGGDFWVCGTMELKGSAEKIRADGGRSESCPGSESSSVSLASGQA
jgi:hypothetical protein